MDSWILISIAILILLFAVIAIINKRKAKRPTDYYSLFLIGIIWLAIGIPVNNYVLWSLGILFTIVGLVNKKKWKENRVTWKDLSPEERKLKKWIIVILGILLLAGVVMYYSTEQGLI